MITVFAQYLPYRQMKGTYEINFALGFAPNLPGEQIQYPKVYPI